MTTRGPSVRTATREGLAGATRLRRLTGDGPVWDNHVWLPLDPARDGAFEALGGVHEAGVDIATVNIGYDADTLDAVFANAVRLRNWVASNEDRFCLVRDGQNISDALSRGKLAICFNVEGLAVLGGTIDPIARLRDLGVCWMLIAYNHANLAGGGCMDKPDAGLTEFGRAAIAEMNRVGMLVCCAHSGERTALEAIEVSEHPVIISHANARALFDHPRNVSDRLIRACAERGGVIGLTGLGFMIGLNADIGAFVRHIEYVIDLVGEDHVGLGLDYPLDQGEMTALLDAHPETFPPQLYPRGPEGLPFMVAPWDLADLASLLALRGYGETTIAKLMGGNLLRLIGAVGGQTVAA